jgi:hypothetical protein
MTPMPSNSQNFPTAAVPSSLASRLCDMFAYPGQVFDEVVAAPPRMLNWLVPTLLVAMASLFLLRNGYLNATDLPSPAQTTEAQASAPASAALQVEPGSTDWQRLSAVGVCAGTVAGTFWSAFLLWVIGRAFLKARFSFLKAIEVVGLTGVITALGAVVTALLAAIIGNPSARPALSLLALGLPSDSHVRLFLDAVNFFHLWITSVLAIGLSRLSGVTFKEAAFWVFGYWVVVRLGLILLA